MSSCVAKLPEFKCLRGKLRSSGSPASEINPFQKKMFENSGVTSRASGVTSQDSGVTSRTLKNEGVSEDCMLPRLRHVLVFAEPQEASGSWGRTFSHEF